MLRGVSKAILSVLGRLLSEMEGILNSNAFQLIPSDDIIFNGKRIGEDAFPDYKSTANAHNRQHDCS